MDRYCLTLTIQGRIIMRGWWSGLPTADRKLAAWVGERGGVEGTRITLTDEADEADDGRVLKTWPDETV